MYNRLYTGHKKYRFLVIVCMLVTFVLLLSRCISDTVTEEKAAVQPDRFAGYAGDNKCTSCHKEISDSHLLTAHHLTASPADTVSVMGSFAKGINTYNYTPDIQLAMEKRDSGLFQVAYVKGEEKKAMRFDITIGSGVMGQSYLNWRGNRLYQLPITYFTSAGQWSNSPGFPSQRVMIDRPVTARCLECHATYAEGIPADAMEPVEFDKNRILYGVGCETCHGPAAKHVEYQSKHAGEKTAQFIVNPSKLTRRQQLDICAYCHGGNIQKTTPSFRFAAGSNLSDYFKIDSLINAAAESGNIDVHGNQVGLLTSSQCFIQSSSMTCGTCHDTHQNQRGKKEFFSAKCTGCHNITDNAFKTPVHTNTKSMEKNCIDCHMPAQPSRSIAVFLQGQETPRASLVRSHYIAIYKFQDTKK
jgi:Cytochrome c554 and c-prime